MFTELLEAVKLAGFVVFFTVIKYICYVFVFSWRAGTFYSAVS